MNTQNTPVHIRLWHRHFWFLSLAYLLMSVAVYSFVPVMPGWLTGAQGLSACGVALSVGSFGAGMLLLGGFCNYLVQKFRRNLVCVCSLGVVTVLLLFHYYIISKAVILPLAVWCVMRLAQGAAYGLAQMVLSGILVIDVCESYNRTEANYCMSWFCRLGMALGPVVGMVLGVSLSFRFVVLFAVSCLVMSVLLILSVQFPFRAPDDGVRLFGLDRFWLPQGWLLSVNLLLFSLSVGMVFSVMHSLEFFSMLLVGFLASLLAQRIVFADAELKSEVICGLLLVVAALLLQITRNLPVVQYVVPVLVGLGVGLVSGRFLLFFIKLSRHCQRGTSQSTYNLSWEFGVWTGLALGYMSGCACLDSDTAVIAVAMGLVSTALLLYHFITHRWYLINKNR